MRFCAPADMWGNWSDVAGTVELAKTVTVLVRRSAPPWTLGVARGKLADALTTPPKLERSLGSAGLPALDLDEQLGSFVRQHNKRQVFARLFGSVTGAEMLGRYRLLRHLGQGAMGVVYAAHDETLDRTVAIKLVRTGVGRQRLLREGQAMARLAHPNVVQVYEVGEARSPSLAAADDQLIAYIAMEFVDGVTLARWLRAPRSPQEILATFISAGRGLAAAHEVGLVHRDFKPQNVLVHHDGRVLVTDFGLALAGGLRSEDTGPVALDAGQDLELLTTGGPGGTPAYMAPEAFTGVEVGAHSDQFSFCVALWEALYGRRPFEGSTLSALSQDVQTRELERAPPRRSTPKLPRGVHQALVRGLATEPADRWPNMSALLDELAGALAPSWRKLGAVALLGLVVSGAIMVVLLSLLRSRGLELEYKDRDLARELQVSEAARKELQTSLSVQRGMRALQLIDEDSEGEALLLGVLALGADTTDPAPPEASEGLASVLADDAIVLRPTGLRGPAGEVSELRVSTSGSHVAVATSALAVWELEAGVVRIFEGHVGVVHTVDFSPDGARLVSGGRDHTAKIWTLSDGAIEHELRGHRADVTAARFAPDGEVVATASLDHEARLWEVATGAPIEVLRGHQNFINGLVYAPDGARLATYDYDGRANIWDATTGALLISLDGHEHVVSQLAFSPDGERVATVGFDGRANIWDAHSGALEREIERRSEAIYSVAFAPDGLQLVTGGRRGELRIFELPSGRERARLPHFGSIQALFHSPDGAWIIADAPGDATRIWDADSGRLVAKIEAAKFGASAGLPDGRLVSVRPDGQLLVSDPRGVTSEVRRLPGHREPLLRLAFSPDGEDLATACFGGEVKLWDAHTGALRGTLGAGNGGMFTLAYAPSGALLAAAGEDHHVWLWEAQTHTLRATLRGHRNYVHELAFSPDGRKLASASLDTTTRLWDLQTGTSVSLPGHTHGAQCVAFSPDGRRLASSDGLGRVHTWDGNDGRSLDLCPRHDGQITRLLFSPDGELLASSGVDGLVKLGPAESCAPTRTLLGHEDPLLALAFSPDSRVLASAGEQLRLWETRSGELLHLLEHHDDSVTDLVFSPDGELLASADLGSTIRVWSVASGELVRTLAGHTGSVRDLAFAPDGSILASASGDHTAKLWDARRGVLRTTLTDRLVLDRGDDAPTWPIPRRVLLTLGCERLAPFPEYAEARELCELLAAPASRPE